MKISAIHRGRLTVAAVVVAGATAVVGALTPAASDEVRPFLQALAVISCTSGNPCEEGKNSGKGAGLEGISAKGSGVIGQTNFISTFNNGRSGVLGQDTSASGSFNAGVTGTSPRGMGVVGTSTNSYGILGISSGFTGVAGTSTDGDGVDGTSSNLIGVNGVSTTYVGVSGHSVNSTGVEGTSLAGIGVHADGGYVPGTGVLQPALSVNGNDQNPDLIYACSPAIGLDPCTVVPGFPIPEFVAVNNGNVFITGQIFTSGQCSSGCASSPSKGEQRVRLFTPQESLPTVEDFGEAQLVGGQTYVRIDPAFAKTTDNHAAYMVFITPEGDSNGLYVINKTGAGFEVRENKDGRSTLAFSYRIVAKPFGQHPAKLQMITVTKPGMSLPTTSRIR
jgi:hypothetical protein